MESLSVGLTESIASAQRIARVIVCGLFLSVCLPTCLLGRLAVGRLPGLPGLSGLSGLSVHVKNLRPFMGMLIQSIPGEAEENFLQLSSPRVHVERESAGSLLHSCRPFAPIREAVGVLYRGHSHVQLPSAGHGLGYWQSSVPASLQRWARFNRCSTLSENETKEGGASSRVSSQLLKAPPLPTSKRCIVYQASWADMLREQWQKRPQHLA